VWPWHRWRTRPSMPSVAMATIRYSCRPAGRSSISASPTPTPSVALRDGVLRIVVSAQDPGIPNWLDTAGYPRGVVQGRWIGCESPPVPSTRKLAFEALRTLLPAGTPRVTPTQREAAIRERRATLQQRPLW
jgi:hypothetical protein